MYTVDGECFLAADFPDFDVQHFSAGSKDRGAFPDDGSRRVSHLFEVPEKGLFVEYYVRRFEVVQKAR